MTVWRPGWLMGEVISPQSRVPSLQSGPYTRLATEDCGRRTADLEGLKGRLLVGQDGEQLIELGDLEHLADLLGDVAQHQLAPDGLDLAVHGDELAQGGARQELDVAEVEEDLASAQLVDEPEQVVADHLDVLLVQDLLVHKVDDRDVSRVLDLQAAAAGLLTHTASLRMRTSAGGTGQWRMVLGMMVMIVEAVPAGVKRAGAVFPWDRGHPARKGHCGHDARGPREAANPRPQGRGFVVVGA